MATDCCCPPDSLPTGWRTEGTRAPSFLIIASASCSMRARSIMRIGVPSSFLRRLAAEEDVGGDVLHAGEGEVLVDHLDAALADLARRVAAESAPSKRIVPPSGLWMPVMIFISVDLPAPLSPTSATTSPASTLKVDAAQRPAPARNAS